MKDNQHIQTIPSTVLTQARNKIDEAKALLAPCMLALTPAERRELLKMGGKTIGFVEKACDFARQNPGLVPPYLGVDAFSADFSDAHGLWTLLNSIRQLEEGVDDTEMTAGSEAYQAALVFYKPVKMAAAQDIPGAKAIYEEMKTRFPRTGRPRGASHPDTSASNQPDFPESPGNSGQKRINPVQSRIAGLLNSETGVPNGIHLVQSEINPVWSEIAGVRSEINPVRSKINLVKSQIAGGPCGVNSAQSQIAGIRSTVNSVPKI
jgi:hypothetical protein